MGTGRQCAADVNRGGCAMLSKKGHVKGGSRVTSLKTRRGEEAYAYDVACDAPKTYRQRQWHQDASRTLRFLISV